MPTATTNPSTGTVILAIVHSGLDRNGISGIKVCCLRIHPMTAAANVLYFRSPQRSISRTLFHDPQRNLVSHTETNTVDFANLDSGTPFT